MAAIIRAATPVISIIVVSATISGIALAGFGVWLVYLGSTGDATITIFGQHLQTTMAGIPAIFVGAVIIGAVLRSSLKTVRDLGGGPGETPQK
jgi:hypothetical protein